MFHCWQSGLLPRLQEMKGRCPSALRNQRLPEGTDQRQAGLRGSRRVSQVSLLLHRLHRGRVYHPVRLALEFQTRWGQALDLPMVPGRWWVPVELAQMS